MFVQAPQLSALSAIKHAFFTREGGVSEGLYGSLNGGLGSNDEQVHVQENRCRMAAALGIEPVNLLSLYQIHSPHVMTIERPWEGPRPQADAMVTRVPGLALGISTADCGPVLFVDNENGVIGAAHAGWKGAFGGVLEATVAAMETLGARREAITAVLGPTISRANYEVGTEFEKQFREASADNASHFTPSDRDGHFMFDLPGYISRRMDRLGIGSFHDMELCTYADEKRFYSFRRATHRNEPDYGRLISAITLTA